MPNKSKKKNKSKRRNKSKTEPETAPEFDRWYNLTLGPSFKDESANGYCTLQYESKPASVDKTKPGMLHKTKENMVSVEFQNKQTGKPKATFEGISEECEENEAVLFFDGKTFRLEKLHSVVKELKQQQIPGESTAAMTAIVAGTSGSALDPQSSPIVKSVKPAPLGKSSYQAVPVVGELTDIGEPENTGIKSGSKGSSGQLTEPPIATSPDAENEVDEHQDMDNDDLFVGETSEDDNNVDEKDSVGFDMMSVANVDDLGSGTFEDDNNEIVDVNGCADEVDKGPNASDDLFAGETPEYDNNVDEKDSVGFDMSVPNVDDLGSGTLENDDNEIVDVNGCADEVDKGPSAAEAESPGECRGAG